MRCEERVVVVVVVSPSSFGHGGVDCRIAAESVEPTSSGVAVWY